MYSPSDLFILSQMVQLRQRLSVFSESSVWILQMPVCQNKWTTKFLNAQRVADFFWGSRCRQLGHWHVNLAHYFVIGNQLSLKRLGLNTLRIKYYISSSFFFFLSCLCFFLSFIFSGILWVHSFMCSLAHLILSICLYWKNWLQRSLVCYTKNLAIALLNCWLPQLPIVCMEYDDFTDFKVTTNVFAAGALNNFYLGQRALVCITILSNFKTAQRLKSGECGGLPTCL